MLKSDQALWERELTDHMNQHPDIRDHYAQFARPRRGGGAVAWVEALLLWSPLALLGTTAGWSIGWFLI